MVPQISKLWDVRERNGAGVSDAVVAVATTADDAPPPKM